MSSATPTRAAEPKTAPRPSDLLTRLGLTPVDKANPDPRHELKVRGLLRLEPDRDEATKGRAATWPTGRLL